MRRSVVSGIDLFPQPSRLYPRILEALRESQVHAYNPPWVRKAMC